jgi:hypothetical protein
MQPELLEMCTFDSNDGGHVDFAQDSNNHATCALLVAQPTV